MWSVTDRQPGESRSQLHQLHQRNVPLCFSPLTAPAPIKEPSVLPLSLFQKDLCESWEVRGRAAARPSHPPGAAGDDPHHLCLILSTESKQNRNHVASSSLSSLPLRPPSHLLFLTLWGRRFHKLCSGLFLDWFIFFYPSLILFILHLEWSSGGVSCSSPRVTEGRRSQMILYLRSRILEMFIPHLHTSHEARYVAWHHCSASFISHLDIWYQ